MIRRQGETVKTCDKGVTQMCRLFVNSIHVRTYLVNTRLVYPIHREAESEVNFVNTHLS